MEKRLRPITYAESLEAKKIAEELDKQIIQPKKEINQDVTSLSGVEVSNLPSGGVTYPDGADIYFTPLSFGEMKYISGSTLNDKESINFFLKKIQTSFPKEDLTYYDFYYITVLIKLSTFGDINYVMNFECGSCGHINKAPFTTEALEFEEIRVPLPITVDLESPFTYMNGEETSSVKFSPITIGRYLDLIESSPGIPDEDDYLANCLVDGSKLDRQKIIKEVLIGPYAQLLESIEVYMYHGVKDIIIPCRNRLKPKDMTQEEFNLKRENNEEVGEVCGHIHNMPFQYITEHISSTSEFKNSLGERVHFGI